MARPDASIDQFLTFTLGGEIFALDIARVREVLGLRDITGLPRMPEHLMGVINLRDRAVPVVDLRLTLGLSPAERTVDTCIIILEVYSGEGDIVMGVMVDSVREVFEMAEADIEPAPRMGARDGCLRGMGRQGDRFVIIIDADAVFADSEIGAEHPAVVVEDRAA